MKHLSVFACLALAIIWSALAVCVMFVSPVWIWFCLLLMAGLIAPFTELAWMVFVPVLVADDQLERANGMGELVFQAGVFTGPLVGSWLIAIVGSPAALLVDAWTFVVAALAIPCLKVPMFVSETDAKAPRGAWWKSLQTGARYLITHRVVLVVTALAFVLNFAYGVIDIALPTMVQRQFFQPATRLGMLIGLQALGMGIAACFYSWQGQRLHHPSWPFWLIGMFGLCMSSYFFARGQLFDIAIPTFLAGTVFGMVPPMFRAIIQRAVPTRVRGAVFGIRAALISFSVPLGGFVAGNASVLFGWRPSMVISGMAVVVTLAGLGCWLWMRRDCALETLVDHQ
ncbi:MFS transporter [Alicyclobacillus suci]|uniref:MFS transporter n=1 Tax=Alicyclobacillus suci TaxID=2816080 RepID=UPI001A903338|nr:MFS transporter [Alicyclobacillus suci]